MIAFSILSFFAYAAEIQMGHNETIKTERR
jgi:hypothetical protein